VQFIRGFVQDAKLTGFALMYNRRDRDIDIGDYRCPTLSTGRSPEEDEHWQGGLSKWPALFVEPSRAAPHLRTHWANIVSLTCRGQEQVASGLAVADTDPHSKTYYFVARIDADFWAVLVGGGNRPTRALSNFVREVGSC